MLDDVLTLIGTTTTVNAVGDTVETETTKELFCEVKSVGMSEKYTALGVGLNPEIKFVISDYYDYNGETLLTYDSVQYNIIRTYRVGEQLEIVCGRVR